MEILLRLVDSYTSPAQAYHHRRKLKFSQCTKLAHTHAKENTIVCHFTSDCDNANPHASLHYEVADSCRQYFQINIYRHVFYFNLSLKLRVKCWMNAFISSNVRDKLFTSIFSIENNVMKCKLVTLTWVIGFTWVF